MKRLLSLALLILGTVMSVAAQTNKIAVLDFKASVGISQQDVNGISSIFITYFSPQGWTLVERTQIDKVISEQGFQKSSMTESQMVRVGRILNLKKIVIGDVNVISGSYNLDVRVVDVESGTISAKDGASWSGSSYRSLMQTLATRLANKIAITQTSTSTVKSTSSATPTTTISTQKPVVAPTSSATNVITLYGYLKIHPKNLGVFSSEPTTVISNLNKNGEYGYDSWRIPTKEEWELILSNANSISGISANQPYMTSANRFDGKDKVVRLVTTDAKTVAEKERDKQEAARQAELARQEAARKAEIARQEAEQRRLRNEQERAIAQAQEQARLQLRKTNPLQAIKNEFGLDVVVVQSLWDERGVYHPVGYRTATDFDIEKIGSILYNYIITNYGVSSMVVTGDFKISETAQNITKKKYTDYLTYSYYLDYSYWSCFNTGLIKEKRYYNTEISVPRNNTINMVKSKCFSKFMGSRRVISIYVKP